MGRASEPLRVLVVDDEPLLRWSLMETLSERGLTVSVAPDGATAMRTAAGATAPFDVVLLDFRLPDSSDLALLARLRRTSPASVVILMTAYSTADVVAGAYQLGARHVLAKPFDVHAISDLVVATASNTERVM